MAKIILIKMYQEGENALFYIDQSAKYSTYGALYSFAKRGTYYNDPECSLDESGYVMWQNVIQDENIECYPTETDIATSFASFLNNQLDEYIKKYPEKYVSVISYPEKYPSTVIPQNNYDFNFNETEDSIKITGIATQNILISKENADYAIKPSFKTKIPYKLINKSKEFSNNAKKIKNNITNCLIKGSHTPNDKEDLSTCSDINRLKTEIDGIEHYQITPISFPDNYTLLFDIEDRSFKNPYSDEKLTTKFGMRFLDTFPPPLTQIIGTETQGEDISITWKKNNASDVISYSIYGRSLEPTYIDENNLIAKDITQTEWKVDYDLLEKGQTYYFYVIAEDNAANKAQDIQPIQLTI